MKHGPDGRATSGAAFPPVKHGQHGHATSSTGFPPVKQGRDGRATTRLELDQATSSSVRRLGWSQTNQTQIHNQHEKLSGTDRERSEPACGLAGRQ